MKTITLDEEAYKRLKAWKRSKGDSFSKVVKRVVPEAGAMVSFLNFAQREKTDQLPGNETLEAAIEERPTANPDPWNS